MKHLAKYQDQEKSDENLVKLALENPDDFLYLIERYNQRLLRYIMRISGLKNEDAEDLLQEIYIKVYRNLNEFDESLKFSSWIYRIARNHVISNYRKLKRRPQSIIIDNEFLENLSSDFDVAGAIDLKYLRKDINKVLEKMDIKYREVLILKFLEEKEYKEISDILKKPMGTVAILIKRAKKIFKETYEKEKF